MEKQLKFTLTALLRYCIENYGTKKNGLEFTLSDIQGYIRRGKLPEYMQGYKIVRTTEEEIIGIGPIYLLEMIEEDNIDD